MLAAQDQSRERIARTSVVPLRIGAEAKEAREKIGHRGKHAVGIESAGKAQSVTHSLFASRMERRALSEHRGPAQLLLRVDRHALKLHLLPRQSLLLAIETLGAVPAQLLQDRALRQLLLVDAVFEPEPKKLVEFIPSMISRVALEEIPDPRQIQPLLNKTDHHVEVMVGRSVREEGHEGRLEIIVAGGVPDDVSCASGAAGIMLFDHV